MNMDKICVKCRLKYLQYVLVRQQKLYSICDSNRVKIWSAFLHTSTFICTLFVCSSMYISTVHTNTGQMLAQFE